MRALALILVTSGAALAFSAFAQPVAFVTDIHGEVTVVGGARVAFLSELSPATRIAAPAGAKLAVLFFASGAEYVFAGPGEFAIEADQVKALSGAAPSRRAVSTRPSAAVMTQVVRTATASVRMRSVAPPAALKPGPAYPRNAQIATLLPQLRWNGEPGAQGYTLVVRSADGKEVWKGAAKSSPHRLPLKLAAATRYSWSVTGQAPLGEASFETETADVVAKAEQSRAAAKTFPDRVMHALLLEELGAKHDAREAWAALARERPDLPELAALAK